MNRQQLIFAVMDETGCTELCAETIIDSVFNQIKLALVKGDYFKFVGMFTMQSYVCKPRKFHNPQNGKIVRAPKRKRIKFKTHGGLDEAINDRPSK